LKTKPDKIVVAVKRKAIDDYQKQLGAEALVVLAEWGGHTELVIQVVETVLQQPSNNEVAVWYAARAIIALNNDAGKASRLAPRLAEEWYRLDEKHGPIYIYAPDDFSATCIGAFAAMGADGEASVRYACDSAYHSLLRKAAKKALLEIGVRKPIRNKYSGTH
jgi:hypothetical protein